MHEQYMRRCLELAQRASGHTSPNPMVGAVLVHEGRIIGEGWHEQYGDAHAEVNCFDHVAAADRHLVPHSTMYVSLEPCAHYGKTPPCALRIVQEGVQEVYIAHADPFDMVQGAGIGILREAGITVHMGYLEQEAAWQNRRFFCFHERQRPYIILKWAQSAEGYMAPADRSRVQLSNAFSQAMVHQWRTEEAAIMVGYRTALHDNPQLTARNYRGKQPLRIALDRNLGLPLSHHLLDGAVPTWIIHETGDKKDLPGVQMIQLPFDELLLPHILQLLYQQQQLSLIVEGGAALLQSFISQGLWDEARIFKTPVTLTEGIPAPVLTHTSPGFATGLQEDILELRINNSSNYLYPEGMPL